MRLIASIALGLGIFHCVPAWAVTLDPVRGDVTINQGDGFRRVTTTMQVNAGDAVMVGPGDSAWLVYPDCTVEVKPGAVVTITELSPCEAPSDIAPTQFSVNNGMALGTLVVGGGIVGAILLLNKSNDKPASP
jgi:hypothetical protein